MTTHITSHRDGFGPGFTPITTLDDTSNATGIALGTLRLRAGESEKRTVDTETAFLLMDGTVHVSTGDRSQIVTRNSLFDQGPSCIHVAAGTDVTLRADAAAEFTVYQVANQNTFANKFYNPDDVDDEPRGRGQVHNTCLRFVRTIFDDTNSDPACLLVLGEVITLPGRWSSYPPHHHPQPEIYHYRFTKPQGYGHAELGDNVLKVRHNDTIQILPPQTHVQCAAPGYGMYYSWVIRHLPGRRYTIPVFVDEHKWIMEPNAECWLPAGLKSL